MKDTLKFFEISQPLSTRTNKKFFTQLSCHFEEFLEGLEAINNSGYLNDALENAIVELRAPYSEETFSEVYSNVNRIALADSLSDQYVTLIGTARLAGIDIQGCVAEVEASNLSKYVPVGIMDISDLEWMAFDAHSRKIESEGRYSGVHWKRVGEYVVWYDGSGKVLKGPNFFEPNLEKFV